MCKRNKKKKRKQQRKCNKTNLSKQSNSDFARARTHTYMPHIIFVFPFMQLQATERAAVCGCVCELTTESLTILKISICLFPIDTALTAIGRRWRSNCWCSLGVAQSLQQARLKMESINDENSKRNYNNYSSIFIYITPQTRVY